MATRTGRTCKLAGAVLIVVNFTVMLLCILLFALALWMISSPSTLSSAIQSIGTPAMKALLPRETVSLHLGVPLAALSGFLFFVSFMGFYGAVCRSQFLLFMYATLVVLLLLLECALMYYFSSNLVEKGLQEQDGQWTHAMRLAFRCCEHNLTSSSQDVSRLPWSCCGTPGYPNNCTASNIFTKNCHSLIPAWLSRYSTAIYASLSALHLVLATCAIVRRSRGSKYGR